MTLAEDRLDAVVLVGGRGTRLAPYTANLPKPLVPIGGMPVLEILVHRLHVGGVGRIVMAVGHLSSLITAYFGDGGRFKVPIEYSLEDTPLGTAGPLSLVQNLTDPFLVVNGDLLTDLDFRVMIKTHNASGALATIGLFARSEQIELGVIETDDQDRVTGYIEKPTYQYRASMGAYVFGRAALAFVPADTRFDLPDLIRALIAARKHVAGFEHKGYWLDIGRPEDYTRAQQDFERMRDRLLDGPGKQP
ncbi:MAG: sugar phosphate nucleotidyltransferase [Acidobacteria bacterium]|nr:sugar phosphate nucleotidyltransferase [Acidobacteriota bacterium]